MEIKYLCQEGVTAVELGFNINKGKICEKLNINKKKKSRSQNIFSKELILGFFIIDDGIGRGDMSETFEEYRKNLESPKDTTDELAKQQKEVG